ncbi:hypothetical protein EIP91_004767 [Steccherinum ochraceum]|uniref:NADAR domain-containing protein n=1 Tax=Steccherinum ochraceum TaxID=92696 RepID=A0A4R0R872_9APHY|nr:hypothetical protein EIP91_004767 [Steccherinum ochraceum]
MALLLQLYSLLAIAVLLSTLLIAHIMRTKSSKARTSPRKRMTTGIQPSSSSSSTTTPMSSSNSDNYVFFWKVSETHGYLSQWYHSPFTTRIHLPGEAEPRTEALTFNTAEHYMMACKALLFDDLDVFNQILAEPSDMARIKALGREVKNFVDEVWNKHREEIVLNGSLAKFSEEGNKELRDRLLGTGEKVLVEASPRDRVWGVGYGEKRALEVKDRWGLNLLGIALMKTRETLRVEKS